VPREQWLFNRGIRAAKWVLVTDGRVFADRSQGIDILSQFRWRIRLPNRLPIRLLCLCVLQTKCLSRMALPRGIVPTVDSATGCVTVFDKGGRDAKVPLRKTHRVAAYVHSIEKKGGMWIIDAELQQLGFRRRSRRYWQCEWRYGLPDNAYISIYAGGKDSHLDREPRNQPRIVEVSAFHVTFLLDVDNVHFYYHEYGDGVWEAGGHTSGAEIARHDADPLTLRQLADAIAAEFVMALAANLLPRTVL
jgi:hypothetical protein